MNEEMDDNPVPEVMPPGVGATLKSAREVRGMSVQEAGTRLRLMARQIEAMEADDFASLGQPVFARGFVRNYARMLGLNEEPLLAQMLPARVTVAPQTENLPFAPKPGFWTSPLVMGSIVVVVLAITLPIALYLWLNSGDKEENVAPVVEQVIQTPAPAPVVETPPDMQPELQPDTPAGGYPQTGDSAPPQTTPPSTSPPTTTSPGTISPGTAQTPAVSLQPAVPAMSVAKPASTAPASVTAQSIQFRLAAPAWLQVRDSTGKMVHSALNLAGSNVEVKGVPPFTLVVGNAANVQVTYKNKPVDIKPYIDVTVARFSLN